MRVRNADGQVLEIDEADARFYEQRGFTPETSDQLYSGIRTEAATPEDRGVIGTINAGATGFLSGATLGASDYLLKGVLDEDQFKRLAHERESHPVASITGQIAGGILPAFAAPGSVLGSSPSGLVSHAVNRAVAEGRAIGGAAGTGRVLAASGVEGAIQNAGAYFADTALADRDLSAEGIAGALGIGFGFGAGASAAVLGVTQGTIAARRMFSRIADGSERSATEAEQAWQRTYQETVEANNAAIEVARAKLAQAQAARAEAQLASQREAANVAAAKVRPGIDWATDPAPPTGVAVVSMAPGTIDDITGAAGKIEMAGQLRDRAMLRPPMTESAAADLATAVAEHDAALAELDDLLQRLNAPAVEPGVVPRNIVPIAEFGAPGQRGYAPGEIAAPRPPTVVEAATGDVTAVGKRRAVAEGTPAGIGAPETVEQQWESVMARLKGETDVPTRLRLQAEADELMDRMTPIGAGDELAARADDVVPVPVTDAPSVPTTPEPIIKGKTIAELKHPDETAENFVLRRMRTQGEAFGDPSFSYNDKRFLGSLGIDWTVPENRAVMMRMMSEGKAVFARADLVGAMDPAMVKASEIVELGPTGREISSWHFILDTGQPVKFPETTPKVKPIAADTPSALEDLVRAQRATFQDAPVRTISSRQEFHKYQDELRAMLTPDEIKNSLRYSREEYNNINRFLRGDKRSPKLSSDEAEIIPALDSVIAKSPSLKETMITHRAIHFDPGEGAHALKPGDVFSDPAYLSTSWRADNINRFGNVHFVVTSPPGTKIAAIPSAAPEGEFLFGRNARLRITAREELPGDRIRLHATAEPAQAASISPTDSLTGQLRATLGGLDSGKGLNELGAPGRAKYAATKATKTKESSEYFRAKALENRRPGHPLSIKELETAHDAALERAATAAEPAAREVAEAEVQALERHLTAVGARPGAVEDVAAIAPAVTKYERASAKVVEALGDEAPPLAREAAKAVRAAEETAERRFMDRTTRAIDDNAEESWMTEARQMMVQEGRAPRFTPAERSKRDAQLRKWEMTAARTDKSKADARLANARAAEIEAKIGMRQAHDADIDARHALEQAKPASTEAIGGQTSRLGAAALTVGVAGELGVPGIPRPTDIPVVGPLLGMYLKYRAIKAAAGRFVGRVNATGDTRAAALVARTKDRMALAVDRTLGLVAETAPKARGPAVASAVALGRRVFDDGEPDAKKGASPSELAAVRIREISTAASRPDLVKAMVRREMRGVSDPDLIAAAEAHLIARFDHLANVIPKAPPPNPYSRREWRPSPAAASELGHRLAVADDPEAMFAPNATPASIETARALWPKLLDLAKRRLIERIGDAKRPVTYQQRLRGSLLFQIPLDDSMRPENAAILQGASTGVPPAPPPTASSPPVPAIAGPIDLTAMYQPGTDRRALMR